MKLTQEIAAALALPAGKKDHIEFDETLPGFGLRLRVSEEGAKPRRTWIAQFRIGDQQRRISIGRIEVVPISAARSSAKSILGKAADKVDVKSERDKQREQARTRSGDLFAKWADAFLAAKANPPTTGRGAKRRPPRPRTLLALRDHLTNHWAGLASVPLTELTRRQISVESEKIAETRGPIAMNRAASTLHAFLAWTRGKGVLDTSPEVGLEKADEEARDRCLDDPRREAKQRGARQDEIRTIWQALGDDDHSLILKLLFATGARRTEIGGMRKSELDFADKLWILPASRSKNHEALVLPLSDLAIDIINKAMARPERQDRDLIFGNGRNGFSGWSHSKRLLDERIAAAGPALEDWRVHDVRRSVATHMAGCGVLPHIIECVLNHVGGFKSGVAGVYGKNPYEDEMRDALDRWATRLATIVSGADNVVALPAKRA